MHGIFVLLVFPVVACAFFLTVGCWVYFVFVDCLHCMVMFILNTRDGIYNRFLCKRKRKEKLENFCLGWKVEGDLGGCVRDSLRVVL